MDIVLIPGALATPKLYQSLENDLQGKFRFHYVDILSSSSIPEMAKRFIKHAPDEFILIGFSMGGYVALELFSYIPEKIKKLVLINSAAKILSIKGQLERERSLSLIDRGKFDLLISLIFKTSIHDKNKYAQLLPIAQEMAQAVGVKNYINQLNAILEKPDHSGLLSSIKCPTLLIVSQEDKVMPKERSEHLASSIKDAELICLENCGHLATLEQPERINQILSAWL